MWLIYANDLADSVPTEHVEEEEPKKEMTGQKIGVDADYEHQSDGQQIDVDAENEQQGTEVGEQTALELGMVMEFADDGAATEALGDGGERCVRVEAELQAGENWTGEEGHGGEEAVLELGGGLVETEEGGEEAARILGGREEGVGSVYVRSFFGGRRLDVFHQGE